MSELNLAVNIKATWAGETIRYQIQGLRGAVAVHINRVPFRVGELIDEDEINQLISRGVTVNIRS